MVGKLHLWAQFLKTKLKPTDKKYRAIAEEATQRASDLAERIMADERAALDIEGLADLFNDKMMLSIELQFLWGIFHEFVQEYRDLPTNGFDRIKLHLIQRLMDSHGYSFEAARDEAISVEDLYNKADEIFDAVSRCGKEAFHDARPGRLAVVVKALHETNLSVEAYR